MNADDGTVRSSYWEGKQREEDKRRAALTPEQRLASWTAAVNELYRVQGFDDPQKAARRCLTKQAALLAHEPKLPRNFSTAK